MSPTISDALSQKSLAQLVRIWLLLLLFSIYIDGFREIPSVYPYHHKVRSTHHISNIYSLSLYSGNMHTEVGISRPSFKSHQQSWRKNLRKQKFARILHDELIEILQRGQIKSCNRFVDNRFMKFISITDIDLNSDCSTAKIFVSMLGNAFDKRKMIIWLSDHRNQVQHLLHVRLRHMKKIPRVSFHLLDAAAWHLQNTLDELEKESSGNTDLSVSDNFDINDVDFNDID